MRRMQQEIEEAAASITDSKEMYLLRKQYLDNKTGKISALMKNMRDLAPEDRPAFGKIVNELKQWALDFFTEQDARLKAEELAKKNAAEQIDVTMPAPCACKGALHPDTLIVNELIDIFAGMGFTIFEGPEIENDYYNFTALNTPADHPARDMQDTFYITEELLLRTQTSAGQIRVMENAQPPIKILSPGKVFRSDDDATHSPMFSQMEGLVVDKGITLCDLQGMLDVFAQRIFGEQVRTRLRPSYFPFTEPSVEVDVSCFACGGKGCRLCKDTGWIEVLGAGMVNRHVLENCGVDPDVYTGFAFGMGVERIAMLKYGINNIKLLFESDVRVLEQFRD
ncbi:MAG: phenylalanine--tRNA ligase subunit alpha [Oscillospiraceae bacterium]|nr:phenylalanine--tRNA ligase subunit alpha [Ruminococcus sp.]MBQ4346701.1 phenylalanine--tRNA ligase subunit alpha [Oscillospiraceae bacterium]